MSTYVWEVIKHEGWAHFLDMYDDFAAIVLQELIDRMEEALAVTKAIVEGEIPPEDTSRTITFWIIPPVLISRADLLQGTTRLIYGNSCDITFMGLHDLTKEILFAINYHFEEGLPTNYWFFPPGDPMLEKRHMQLGLQLKEIPQHFDTLNEAGHNVIPILKDIRNEQDPAHYQSSYNMCFFNLTGGSNNGICATNYDEYSYLWEGVNCGYHKLWNKCSNGSKSWVPDAFLTYEPWPPIFLQLIRLKREMWCKRIAGLLTESQIYLQYVLEQDALEKLGFPVRETWKMQYEEGLPLPDGVFRRQFPNLSGPRDKWVFGYQYPKDIKRIYLEDLGITINDAMNGVLLDIKWEEKDPDISSKNIISIGHGLHTKFEKEV